MNRFVLRSLRPKLKVETKKNALIWSLKWLIWPLKGLKPGLFVPFCVYFCVNG